MQAQLTEQTRRALADARREASESGSACVEPEHLLSAILRGDHSEACAVLSRNGFVAKAIYDDLCALLDAPTDDRADAHSPRSVVLSADAERLLVSAARRAAHHGRYYMGTDHLLLALVAEPNDALTALWKRHGVPADLSEGERDSPASSVSIMESRVPRRLYQRPLWNHYTFSAKQALMFAANEARQSGQHRLLPPFLLAGVLQENDTVAANALRQLGAGRNDLRLALADLLEPGGNVDDLGELLFGKSAYAAITEAERVAQTLGDSHIGTEHLLLGLLAGEGETATLLRDRGIVSANFLDALRSVKRGNHAEGSANDKKAWQTMLATVLLLAGLFLLAVAYYR